MRTRSKGILPTCAAIFLLSGASSLAAPTLDNPQWALIQKAEAYRENGDYRSAIIELKNALQADPQNQAARFLLGRTHLDVGDGAAAEKELRRALELGFDPEAVAPPLVEALLLQGRFSEALDAIIVPQGASADRQADDQILRGEAYLGLGQTEPAENALKAAIELSPRSSRALRGLARVRLSLKDKDGAFDKLHDAVDANPADADAWALLGDLFWNDRNLPAAENAYTRAIDSRPAHQVDQVKRALIRVEAQDFEGAAGDLAAAKKADQKTRGLDYVQGLLAFRQGRLEEARDHLIVDLNTRPNHLEAVYFLGATQFGLGSFEQADGLLSRVLAQVPDAADAYAMLGIARLNLKDARGAEEALRQALDLKPNDPTVLRALARAVRAQGRPDEANEYLELAVRQGSDSAADRLELGISHLRSGDWDRGEEQLRRAKELRPDLTTASALIVQQLLQRGETAAAIDEAEVLISKRPDDPDVLALAGVTYVGAGDEQRAIELFEQALAKAPGLPNAALNLAELATRKGDTEKARDYLGQVLEHNPGHQRALTMLAALEARLGDVRGARKLLTHSAEANPDSVDAQVVLARFELDNGDALAAIAVLRGVAPQHGEHPLVLAALGEARLAADDAASAVRDFEKLVWLRPESADARYALGMALLRNGDRDGAKEALLEGLRLDPDPKHLLPSARLMTDLVSATRKLSDKLAVLEELKTIQPAHPQLLDLEAQLAARQGDRARPVEIYRGLMERFPESPVWMRQLAKAQWKAGDKTGHLGTLNDWIADHPQDAAAYAMLAKGYLRLDRMDEAKTALEKTLALAPDNAVSLNNLAWLLREEDPKRALELARKARKLRPEDLSIQDSLGTILLLQGKSQEALPLLKDAAEKSPTNASVQYHYALAQEKSGDKLGAVRTLRLVLKEDPDFPERPQALSLLSRLDGESE